MLNRLRHFSRRELVLLGAELLVIAALPVSLAAAASRSPAVQQTAAIARMTGGEISAEGFAKLTASMDPAMLTLAGRFEPRAGAQIFALRGATGAQLIQASADAAPEPAVLRLQDLDPAQARAWNASNPISNAPNPAAKPFHLATGGMLDETRAVDCMTAAVYYEAAQESDDGQKAVAQVVLNRLRHPAYPKTVCGVVFQGSNRTTGCQFTFTCDGSLARAPSEAGWARARKVAVAALNGAVMKKVGNATHYHAVYVAPYWSPSLVKVANIGAHIFYRWTGGWGMPGAFGGRYEGSEADGLRAAELDRLGGSVQLASNDDIAAGVAANVVPEAAPESRRTTETPVAAAELVTAADAARDAGAMVRAEDLNWNTPSQVRTERRIALPTL